MGSFQSVYLIVPSGPFYKMSYMFINCVFSFKKGPDGLGKENPDINLIYCPRYHDFKVLGGGGGGIYTQSN